MSAIFHKTDVYVYLIEFDFVQTLTCVVVVPLSAFLSPGLGRKPAASQISLADEATPHPTEKPASADGGRVRGGARWSVCTRGAAVAGALCAD